MTAVYDYIVANIPIALISIFLIPVAFMAIWKVLVSFLNDI